MLPGTITEPVRFTEELRVQFGPKREIGRFLLEGDRTLTEMGVRLYVSDNLRRLYDINQRHLDSWAPLMPIFDPVQAGVRVGPAFLFELRDIKGDVVATQVTRRIDLAGSTLKAELEQLNLFYRDPASQRGNRERIDVTAPMASEITGRVSLSGGLWYRPDWRGKGLSQIFPRMTRTFAYTNWDTDYTISFVEQPPIDHGILQMYGLPVSQPWIKIRDSYRPEVDLQLTWRPKAEIASDVAAYAADLAKRRERTSWVPVIQNSPELARQGKSRRS